MSSLIRRILLGSASLFSIFDREILVAKPVSLPEPRVSGSGLRHWWSTKRRYPYSGKREAERAVRRLAFKAANGRWP